MEITRELIEDVAAKLGINEPSLVEKDYQVVRALSALTQVKCVNFELVFAGGTCLSKVFKNLQRMSEDVDIKILPTERGMQLTNTARRRALGNLKREIVELLKSADFHIKENQSHNENRYIELGLSYSEIFIIASALRPTIKIELTLCDIELGRADKKITSLIYQSLKKPPEIKTFSCAEVVHTAAEKLVALLRRTAASLRGIDGWSDETLIRHMYDLRTINKSLQLEDRFFDLVRDTVVSDGKQFQVKHPEFLENPCEEIKLALLALNEEKIYRDHYDKFLGPLVYAKTKPTYRQCLTTLNTISEKVWGSAISPHSK